MEDGIHWFCGHHRFNLDAPDPLVRERAECVLARWTADGTTPSTYHEWRIEYSREPVQVLGVGMGPMEQMRRRLGYTGEADRRRPDTAFEAETAHRLPLLSRYLLGPGRRAGKAGWVVRNLATGDVEAVGERPAHAVRAVEYEAVQRVAMDSGEQIAIHSGLVSSGGRGVLIAGPSEAGKSTLSSALWRRGWSYLCDDHALVDSRSASASPTPRRVSLRAPSRSLLGDDLWQSIGDAPSCDETRDEARVFHPEEVDGRSRPRYSELAALVFLRNDGASRLREAEIRNLEPAHALFDVLAHSNVLLRYKFGVAIDQVRPLVERVPAFELRRGPLREMVGSIEDLV